MTDNEGYNPRYSLDSVTSKPNMKIIKRSEYFPEKANSLDRLNHTKNFNKEKTEFNLSMNSYYCESD